VLSKSHPDETLKIYILKWFSDNSCTLVTKSMLRSVGPFKELMTSEVLLAVDLLIEQELLKVVHPSQQNTKFDFVKITETGAAIAQSKNDFSDWSALAQFRKTAA